MIKKAETIELSRVDNFRGGEGYILNHYLLTPDEMYNKGRVFLHGKLEKNCEIGWHQHVGDGETFYILSGEGEFNDNGTVSTVRAGDVCYTDEGQFHSMKNLKDEPLEYIALVLYK